MLLSWSLVGALAAAQCELSNIDVPGGVFNASITGEVGAMITFSFCSTFSCGDEKGKNTQWRLLAAKNVSVSLFFFFFFFVFQSVRATARPTERATMQEATRCSRARASRMFTTSSFPMVPHALADLALQHARRSWS